MNAFVVFFVWFFLHIHPKMQRERERERVLAATRRQATTAAAAAGDGQQQELRQVHSKCAHKDTNSLMKMQKGFSFFESAY